MTEPTDRLVALHGFTQTHHHLHDLAFEVTRRTGTRDGVTFVDLPGHGLNAACDLSIADAHGVAEAGGAGTYLGYSLGGRFAIAAAVARPDLVRRLIVIGGTAGITDPAARSERVDLDHERADDLERLGVEAFVDQWMAMPMFAGLPDDDAGREHRLRNTATGLATSLRTSGAGAQPSIWDRLADYAHPALIIAGANDDKFVAIGAQLAAALPAATLITIPDAGHAAHLEQPSAVSAAIAEWW